jgi:hypothetical protein
MSRKQNLAAQKLLAEQALYQKQCMVWMRSLHRNDLDIAAVIDLNRSLHTVKNAFLNTYNNELLLLQIGQGKYRLSPDGSDHLVKPTLFVTQHSSTKKSSSPSKSGNTTSTTTNDPSTPNGTDSSIPNPSGTGTATILQYQSIPHNEVSDELQELCVDFLLRRKLRRKLISRIIRRLHRIATSMDHLEQINIPTSSNTNINTALLTDIVAPPGPPKYGDLRLHCDPDAVQRFADMQQKQQMALQQIIATREHEYYQNESSTNRSNNNKSPVSSPKRHGLKSYTTNPILPIGNEPTTTTVKVPSSSQPEKQEELETKVDHTSNVSNENEQGDQTKDLEVQQQSTTAGTPAVSTTSDEIIKTAVSSTDEIENEVSSLIPSSLDAVADQPTSNDSDVVVNKHNVQSDMLIDPVPSVDDDSDRFGTDYEILKDYKDAYEKTIKCVVPIEEGMIGTEDPVSLIQALHKTNSNIQYTILEDLREEDYMVIKNGSGIGATNSSMTTQEREMEYKKWQSNLLARIPEQPTYDELGYENRVFLFEERIQRAVHRQQEKNTESNDDDGKKNRRVEKANSNDLIDDMDVEEKEDMIIESEGNSKGDKQLEEEKELDEEKDNQSLEQGDGIDQNKKDDDDEAKTKDGTKNDEPEPKKTRPISLVAIPSFYEQDLKRIRLVQAELLSSSMRDKAIQRLEDATRDFNQCKYSYYFKLCQSITISNGDRLVSLIF